MMRILLSLCLLTLLASCGADGAPTQPAATTPGVSLSGQVKIGVGGGL